MRLRIELQLILWVTAGVLAALIVFRSDGGGAILVSDLTSAPPIADATSPSAAIPKRIDVDPAPVSQLDEIASRSRSIFSVAVDPVPARPIEAAVPSRVLPILKGIFSIGSEKRAVFLAHSDAGGYVSADVGDEVDDVTITLIDAERVVAVDADEKTYSFTLRGAGEGAHE
jgi:hypothetical protein